jgi:hypothetical protein
MKSLGVRLLCRGRGNVGRARKSEVLFMVVLGGWMGQMRARRAEGLLQ